MTQPASESRRYSYADFCSWPDDEGCELVDGDAHDMSPALICRLDITRDSVVLAAGETG